MRDEAVLPGFAIRITTHLARDHTIAFFPLKLSLRNVLVLATLTIEASYNLHVQVCQLYQYFGPYVGQNVVEF